MWRAINAGSAWAAERLALVFGALWTVWVFFIVPLIAEWFPLNVQAKVFYYASGWVQLFALPLLTWIGNKTQALAEQQAKAQIELTEQVKAIVTENQALGLRIEHLAAELRMANGGGSDDPPPS